MAKPTSAAKWVILGLLVEQPGQTVAEVASTLGERFALARFSTSTAHNVLPALANARAGALVRVVQQGETRSQDRYEVTEAGLAAYRGWMTEPQAGVPAQREALLARIALCSLDDLPALIEMADQEAAVAARLYTEAASALKRHLEAERQNPQPRSTAEGLLSETRNVWLHILPQHWSSRWETNQAIGQLLRGIAVRAGLAVSTANTEPT